MSVGQTSMTMMPKTNIDTIGVVSLNTSDYSQALTEYDSIPPVGYLCIPGHQTRMDVRLFMDGATSLHPYLFAIV